MPLYEYACDTCGKTYEISQKISEEPLKKCPEGHKGFRRLISATSFMLKGTGWYKTDFAGGKAHGKEEASAKSESSSGGGGGHGCGGACSCAN